MPFSHSSDGKKIPYETSCKAKYLVQGQIRTTKDTNRTVIDSFLELS